LLLAASKAVLLASLEAPNPPLEVLALATRNTFELYLRFKHITMSDANSQAWRDEAVTDHLQIYESVLAIDGPESVKAVLSSEISRIRRHAEMKGLKRAKELLSAGKVAGAVGLKNEHSTFYKFYSKLVHPSSFWVNQPSAAATPVFRSVLMFNLQLYGNLILDQTETILGISAIGLIKEAERTLDSRRS